MQSSRLLTLGIFFAFFTAILLFFRIGTVGAEFTNSCGGGTGNPNYYNCPANCSLANRTCSTGSGNGNFIFRFTCNGRVTECVSGEERLGTGTFGTTVGCGQTNQIDVFDHDCRDSGWSCPNGSDDLRGYIVWYGGNCPPITTPPVNTPPPTSTNCSAEGVQARFRLTINGTDIGLVNSGTWNLNDVDSMDFAVVRNMQANPPDWFYGTVRVYTPSGYYEYGNGISRSVPGAPQGGTYTITALENGQYCDGGTITINNTPPWCPCTTYYSCQPNGSPTKFRTQPQSFNGSWKTCSSGGWCNPAGQCDCNPSQGNCSWVNYFNVKPSCSIALDRSTVSRRDAPINMTLTVNDADYGDTVEITNFSVTNSCATVKTTGGGEPFGAVVKVGSNTPGQTSQSNQFIINQKLTHGVFVGANSQCQGTVTMEIRDRVGDATDTQSVAQCTANFTVTNDPPQLVSTELYDRDPVTSVRRGGNQINGQQTIWVGSSASATRPGTCTSPVDINTLNCANSTPVATRGNPYEFAFTVSDANGVNDINYAGVWLQRNDIPSGATAPQLPTVQSGTRSSIQALYNDYNDRQVVQFSGVNHWTTRADFNTNLLSGVNKLSGFRNGLLGGYQSSSSPYQTSLFRAWQIAGFPDCLDTSAKCAWANVPTASQSGFTGTNTLLSNYAWDVVANSTNYICYDATLNARVTSTCDASCSACIRRATSNPIQQINPTTMRFSYELLINEPLPEGYYSLFVMADDKVGVPLNNASTQWAKFDRNGAYCTSCGANQFRIGIDKTPPQYTVTLSEGIGDETVATVSAPTDNMSGIGGLFRTVFTKENTLGKVFLTNQNATCIFNGTAPCYSGGITSGFQFRGYGARGNDIMRAQVCIYDIAGNGVCRPDSNNPPFQAQDKWLKTSLGDVYSNTDSAGIGGFQVQLPNAPGNTDASTAPTLLYAPFTTQQNTITSHLYASASGASGVSGGNASRQGGINNFYRSLDGSSLFNVSGFVDPSGARYGTGGWFNRLLALSNYNCPLLKANGTTLVTGYNSLCQEFNGATLATLDFMENTTVKNKMITLTLPTSGVTTVTRDMTCANTSLIFIQTGHLRFPRQLRNNTDNQADACVFIIASGAALTIADTPDNESSTDVDRFDASIVADGNFTTEFGAKSANQKYAQLQLFGLVFSSRNAPLFKRDLVFSENKRFPSEWLIYNADVVESLRPILGLRQSSEIKCGTSSHPVCGD